MRVDWNLVRVILMNTADGKNGADAQDFVSDCWSWDTVCEHIVLLQEANLVKASIQSGDNRYYYVHVNRLTWEGQQLMESFINDRAWTETLHRIREIGEGVTIDVVKAISKAALMSAVGLA